VRRSGSTGVRSPARASPPLAAPRRRLRCPCRWADRAPLTGLTCPQLSCRARAGGLIGAREGSSRAVAVRASDGSSARARGRHTKCPRCAAH
jgi:hypothetical protein